VDYDIFVNATMPSGEDTPAPELDLRLRPDAKAVDRGVRLPNINDDLTGQAPDLGAHEVGQARPQYGPRR
jgi:hypothetical protein